jgi:hypothetical protein
MILNFKKEDASLAKNEQFSGLMADEAAHENAQRITDNSSVTVGA